MLDIVCRAAQIGLSEADSCSPCGGSFEAGCIWACCAMTLSDFEGEVAWGSHHHRSIPASFYHHRSIPAILLTTRDSHQSDHYHGSLSGPAAAAAAAAAVSASGFRTRTTASEAITSACVTSRHFRKECAQCMHVCRIWPPGSHARAKRMLKRIGLDSGKGIIDAGIVMSRVNQGVPTSTKLPLFRLLVGCLFRKRLKLRRFRSRA